MPKGPSSTIRLFNPKTLTEARHESFAFRDMIINQLMPAYANKKQAARNLAQMTNISESTCARMLSKQKEIETRLSGLIVIASCLGKDIEMILKDRWP